MTVLGHLSSLLRNQKTLCKLYVHPCWYFYSMLPPYLTCHLSSYSPDLIILSLKNLSLLHGAWPFQYQDPVVWNLLPLNINLSMLLSFSKAVSTYAYLFIVLIHNHRIVYFYSFCIVHELSCYKEVFYFFKLISLSCMHFMFPVSLGNHLFFHFFRSFFWKLFLHFSFHISLVYFVLRTVFLTIPCQSKSRPNLSSFSYCLGIFCGLLCAQIVLSLTL